MTNHVYRRIRVTATLMAAASMLVPADAQAFFGLCQKRQNAAAALYGGTVCNPCGQQLVCNYVPQTCYRTQTVQVPVTTMRPVCGADPCTGCPTTVMRPTVSYQQQVQYVPYQSYRLQYSVAQPACPTATTSYYAPAPTSGIGAPVATYAAPTATYAAPASGCSSCNSGAATTSYYAPMPVTTNYAAPRMFAPAATYAAPVVSAPVIGAPTTAKAYSYTATPGNVNVEGYNYATPSAAGIAPARTYGGTSSFTPAPTTSNYAAPTYASPTYAAPNLSAPTLSQPTYSQPTYSNTPSATIPAYTAPSYASPTYSAPTYSTPVPSLNNSATNGSTLNGTTLNGTTLSLAPPPSSSATTGSVYYPPSSSMSPVPTPATMPSSGIPALSTPAYSTPNYSAPTTTAPALSLPGVSSPGTSATPIRSPYSSGVSPTGTAAPTGPAMQPIPDPEMNRGLRMGPTSTPALIDPEDKTAMAWPVRRAWDYRVVGAGSNIMQASLTTAIAEAPIANNFAASNFNTGNTAPEMPAQPTFAQSTVDHSSLAQPAAAARLGAPRSAMEIEVMYAPKDAAFQSSTPQPAAPSVDADGWRSAAR